MSQKFQQKHRGAGYFEYWIEAKKALDYTQENLNFIFRQMFTVGYLKQSIERGNILFLNLHIR